MFDIGISDAIKFHGTWYFSKFSTIILFVFDFEILVVC